MPVHGTRVKVGDQDLPVPRDDAREVPYEVDVGDHELRDDERRERRERVRHAHKKKVQSLALYPETRPGHPRENDATVSNSHGVLRSFACARPGEGAVQQLLEEDREQHEQTRVMQIKQ